MSTTLIAFLGALSVVALLYSANPYIGGLILVVLVFVWWANAKGGLAT